MQDLIQQYKANILPLLCRISDLDKKIALTSMSGERNKLIKRRTGLWHMVQDMQYSIGRLEKLERLTGGAAFATAEESEI